MTSSSFLFLILLANSAAFFFAGWLWRPRWDRWRANRRFPIRFTWTCPRCGDVLEVRASCLDAMNYAEARCAEMHGECQ